MSVSRFLLALLIMMGGVSQVCQSTGLVCRQLDACQDSHTNCSRVERNIVCSAGVQYCYTVLLGLANHHAWLQPNAIVLVLKGCAASNLSFPTCERNINLCNSQSCLTCCDNNRCNGADPRPTPHVTTMHPGTVPVTSLSNGTVTVTTSPTTAVETQVYECNGSQSIVRPRVVTIFLTLCLCWLKHLSR
eukprot:scpid71901/ scgid24700/ 